MGKATAPLPRLKRERPAGVPASPLQTLGSGLAVGALVRTALIQPGAAVRLGGEDMCRLTALRRRDRRVLHRCLSDHARQLGEEGVGSGDIAVASEGRPDAGNTQ